MALQATIIDNLRKHMVAPKTVEPIEPILITNVARHERIEQLRKLAELMDGVFVVPGTKIQFGLDAIIGLVPGIGDVVCGALSLWLIREAQRIGAPKWLVAKMIWNVAVEVGIGAVPVVGDLFDVAWKANRKNIQMLSDHFERKLK